MVQAMINIPEEINHILNIVKARHKLKDKSEAISLVIGKFGSELLEPELRPEYLVKLNKIIQEHQKDRKMSLQELDEFCVV